MRNVIFLGASDATFLGVPALGSFGLPVPTQNSESQRNPGVFPAFRVLSRDPRLGFGQLVLPYDTFVRFIDCPCRKSNPDILMMQPTQDRPAKNVTDGPDGARYRRVLIWGQMRAHLIVIFHVRQQHVTKMSFPRDDDMIDTFPADRTYRPFNISVLPWGARQRWSITNAH